MAGTWGCAFDCADGGGGFGAEVGAGAAADAPVDEGVDEADEGLVFTAAVGAPGAAGGGRDEGVPMCRCLGVPPVGAEVGGTDVGADSECDGEMVAACGRAAAWGGANAGLPPAAEVGGVEVVYELGDCIKPGLEGDMGGSGRGRG